MEFLEDISDGCSIERRLPTTVKREDMHSSPSGQEELKLKVKR